MSNAIERVANSYNGLAILLGRLALGAIYVQGGFSKLAHLGAFASSLADKGLPAAFPLAAIGAAVEFFGAVFIVLGLKTRYVALLMIAFTAAASLISHHFWDFEGPARAMQYVQFMKNLSIIGGFIALFAAGPGPYSLDRRGK